MKRTLITVTVILLLAGPLAWAQESVTQEYVYQVSGRASLELNSLTGNVKISGWDEPRFKVVVTKRGKDSRFEKAHPLVEVDLDFDGSDLEIDVDYPSDQQRSRAGVDKHFDVQVDFDIKVPRQCNLDRIKLLTGDLEVDNVSGNMEIGLITGNMRVTNIRGEIELKVVSGNLYADGIGYELDAKVTSGNIDLRNVTGEVEVSTVSGNIVANAIDIEGFEAASTSGDITLNVSSPVTYGDISIKGMSSSVYLTLPTGSSFDLAGKTATGSIRSDYDLKIIKKLMKNQIRGSVAKGGADIRINTFDGDIVIRR